MGTISKNQKTKKTSVKTDSVSKLNRLGSRKVLTTSMPPEEESIRTGIKKYGRDAYEVTLSNGIAATVLEGNKIYKISPDGKRSVLAKVSKSGVKVTRRSFKIE
jgi:hypothetical protein